MRVAVVVCGDLGRSPRMLYHAGSLADTGADVDLIGIVEHEIPIALREHPRVRVHPLPSGSIAPRERHGLLRYLATAFRNVARQAGALLLILIWRTSAPDAIVVQTPPAIPSLSLAWLAARLRGARLVLDWHNLGWAMLALSLGRDHALVRLARAHERRMGRRADAHLCVSRALGEHLEAWGVGRAEVLADRPAQSFTPTAPDARRHLFERLATPLRLPSLSDPRGRPAVVVSPTSWSADEDFELLVEAAVAWDARLRTRGGAPVAIVMTGEGPRRSEYEHRFAALRLERVLLRTLWLSAEDYPRFLGAADLGLCLHRSASGLDLPMKILDCFGAGLPVVALDYGTCLAELVRDGENGFLFRNGTELAERLDDLLGSFPQPSPALERLRAGVAAEAKVRWSDEWTAVARPLLARLEGSDTRVRE